MILSVEEHLFAAFTRLPSTAGHHDQAPMLVIRGHAYWKEPLATLSNGAQVLNADGRALLLMREGR